MNCKEITQTVKELDNDLIKINDQIAFADSDKIDSLKQEIENLAEKVAEILEPYEIELTDEMIAEQQKTYHSLGLDLDIKKEYKAGNIILPTGKLFAEAKGAGYSELIILPPTDFPIKEAVKNYISVYFEAKDAFGDKKPSKGIENKFVGFRSKTIIKNNKLVGVLFNPNGILQSEFETLGKSVPEMKKIAENKNALFTDGKVEGFSLNGYLFSEVFLMEKYPGYKPTSGKKTRLLQEINSAESCLIAGWNNDDQEFLIDFKGELVTHHDIGARFCIYPEKALLDNSISNGGGGK